MSLDNGFDGHRCNRPWTKRRNCECNETDKQQYVQILLDATRDHEQEKCSVFLYQLQPEQRIYVVTRLRAGGSMGQIPAGER